MTINDQRYTNKNQSKVLVYGHDKHKTAKPTCRGGARRSGEGENSSKFDRIQPNPTKKS